MCLPCLDICCGGGGPPRGRPGGGGWGGGGWGPPPGRPGGWGPPGPHGGGGGNPTLTDCLCCPCNLLCYFCYAFQEIGNCLCGCFGFDRPGGPPHHHRF